MLQRIIRQTSGCAAARQRQRVAHLERRLLSHGLSIDDDTGPPLANSAYRSESTSIDLAGDAASATSDVRELDGGDRDWGLGTLVLDRSGRARFVGSTAASEWLNEDLEPGNATETVKYTTRPNKLQLLSNFPLRIVPESAWPAVQALLPTPARARELQDFYWDLYAFNTHNSYDVVPRTKLDAYTAAFYAEQISPTSWTQDTHPHKLALVFIILSIGSLLAPDVDSHHNEESQTFFEAAEVALSIVNFMKEHTTASVQTLHIMANYHLYDDRLRGGDRAWPLGGLAMRLTQAGDEPSVDAYQMGLHRDGKKWNLPEDVIEERSGNLFSRHFDVEYPRDDPELPFSTFRYQLVRISSSVLDVVMTIEPPPYSTILRLYQQLVDLEDAQPTGIRWSAAKSPSMAARHSRWEETTRSDRDSLIVALKQHTLTLNINENALFLLRTYFARALRENASDPSSSRYKEAFMAIIIDIVKSLYTLHPRVALKHWFFWYHACSAAVCMASIPILAPLSPMALQGWLQLQSACSLFSSVGHQSKSTMASLALLLRLRSSAFDKMSGGPAMSFPQGVPLPQSHSAEVEEEDESGHLMGIHTRLIEQRNRGFRMSRTITSPAIVGSAETTSRTSTGSSGPPSATAVSDFWQLPSNTDMSLANEHPHFSYELPSVRADTPVPLQEQIQVGWNDLDFWLGMLGPDAGRADHADQ
ncbi:hypothetical protein JCM24511_00793 [Saitozyma sp. JCM 24511]|nr:hypothetical protein JCM24511_00793 [Saitozyma sp. JCM 24511]